MSTLLKAFLIGTNDPMELTNIFIGELKKDLQAYSQAKISDVYDIDDWNEEKKDIVEAIEEWEEAIYDIREDIRFRETFITQFNTDINDEKLKENPDNEAIKQLQLALDEQKKSNAEKDRLDKNTIRRHQRHIKLLKEELNYYTKWYKEVVGFSEEEWEEQPITTRLEILNESLDILNTLILEKQKKENLPTSITENIKEQIAADAAKINALKIVSEQEKAKRIAERTKEIRSAARTGAKFSATLFQDIARLKARYEATETLILTLEKQADKEGLELSDELQGKRKKRADDKELQRELQGPKKSKWAKQLAEAEERRKKKLPLHHEKKKIWLEGGFPSWGYVGKDMEKPKYVYGFNERLELRGVKRIPVDAFITKQYKDSGVSLKQFKKNIQEKYPRIMGDSPDQTTSGRVSGGNWLDWEVYDTQLANSLKKPKEDPDGDELLVRLQMFMRSLSEEQIKLWDEPVAVSGKTPHGLTNRDGSLGPKKARMANLKSLLTIYKKAMSELELSSAQVTNVKYIIDRINWAIKSAPKEIKEEQEEDLTEEHQKMIEFFHDVYDMALDIEEAFPDDEQKTYEYEIVKVALEEIQELMNKVDSDNKPEKEELLDILVNFELLSRKAEDLEIPNWGPAKPQIESAISKLEKKLEKFYGELTNKDIKAFKEMLSQEDIGETKRRIKPRSFNYASERKKHVRIYVNGAERIAKKYRDKYIKSEVPLNTEMFLRQLINAYFPKYRVRKSLITTITDDDKPQFVETVEQQELNNQRNRLINAISDGRKVSLVDYPLLYARGTKMEHSGKWEEDGKVKGQSTKIYDKIPVDYSKWQQWERDAEEEEDEIVQQITQDNNRILDDDEMEDFMEVVGEEADVQIAEEELEESVKDKLGEDATQRQVDEQMEKEKQKKLEQDIAALEETDTDKALIARMNKLLDDGKEELKEGENFSQFIKRILAKEKKEKQPSRQIELPKERRIDEERREAEGVGEEEQIDRLRDIIGDDN